MELPVSPVSDSNHGSRLNFEKRETFQTSMSLNSFWEQLKKKEKLRHFTLGSKNFLQKSLIDKVPYQKNGTPYGHALEESNTLTIARMNEGQRGVVSPLKNQKWVFHPAYLHFYYFQA